MTDIEIAQANKMVPVTEIASKIGIKEDSLELYGPYKAKITFEELKTLQKKACQKPGKLILVTAITPTPAGEGKSTVSIGLADGLNKIGKKTVVALRERLHARRACEIVFLHAGPLCGIQHVEFLGGGTERHGSLIAHVRFLTIAFLCRYDDHTVGTT